MNQNDKDLQRAPSTTLNPKGVIRKIRVFIKNDRPRAAGNHHRIAAIFSHQSLPEYHLARENSPLAPPFLFSTAVVLGPKWESIMGMNQNQSK